MAMARTKGPRTHEVGIRDLRANLRGWLDSAIAGDEVVITEHGKPIARLVGPDYTSARQRLIDAGILTPAKVRDRWVPKPVRARGSVTEILLQQRRRGR